MALAVKELASASSRSSLGRRRRRHRHRSTNKTICLLKSPGCLQTNCTLPSGAHVYTIQPPRSCLSFCLLQPSYLRADAAAAVERRRGSKFEFKYFITTANQPCAAHFLWFHLGVTLHAWCENCKELSSQGNFGFHCEIGLDSLKKVLKKIAVSFFSYWE